MMQQTSFVTDGFELPECPTPDLGAYSKILIMMSGGKDSLACLLHLLDHGVERDRIELWHHEVDGREGSGLFDWPVTPAYCQAVAKAFGLELHSSWKEGGLEREMCREDAPTAPTFFETPDGTQVRGGRGPAGTRRKFPAVAASLSTRWCSSYLKISPAECALRNQDRFDATSTLVVTGERAEESRQRAQYQPLEPHRADGRNGSRKRLVDHWRPVLYWPESAVWGIIERHRVMPHPAYFLGFSRCSCAFCIFGGATQFRTARDVLPEQFERISDYEESFGHTIRNGVSVRELTNDATPYLSSQDNPMIEIARLREFTLPIFMDEWRLPSGAFGSSSGPT